METSTSPTTSPRLDTHLERYREQFVSNRRAAPALAARFTEEQMNWHPAPGKWSMADCLVHLCEAGEIYLPVFRTAIDDARRRGLVGSGPYNHGIFGRFLIKQIEPPAKRKMPAPSNMTAGLKESRHRVAEVLARFDRLGGSLETIVGDAAGLDLDKISFPSVISRFMRMNMGAWLEFSAAHERRHLWQAEQVASAPGFPR